MYKKNRADIFAAKQADLLDSITPQKLTKMSAKDATIGAAVLFDKERLERDKSTANIMFFSQINAMANDNDPLEGENESDE